MASGPRNLETPACFNEKLRTPFLTVTTATTTTIDHSAHKGLECSDRGFESRSSHGCLSSSFLAECAVEVDAL
jgi:hypothetical protein